MKKSIVLIVLSTLFYSCTFHKSIYDEKNESHNQVATFKNPEAVIEASTIGEIAYYSAPVIGGAIGYYQNIIKFYPNDNKANQISGALIGCVTGALFSYSYNKIMGHGDIYPIKDDFELQKKWLANLNTMENSNYTIIPFGNYTLVGIPKEKEFDYSVRNKDDFRYFALAFPNSNENEKIITKSFNYLGVSIAPDLKNYFPNNISFIQNEHLRNCSSVQDCYEFAEQNKEYYSLADSKADSLASDISGRYSYLNLFPKGRYSTKNKEMIQKEEFINCKTIDEYADFISLYYVDDVANLLNKAKNRINEMMNDYLNECKSSSDYENYITKYKEQKYGSNELINISKEKAYQSAFLECKTSADYKTFISEYENKNYSQDKSLIKEASENIYRLMLMECKTINNYNDFINFYFNNDPKYLIKIAQYKIDSISTFCNYKSFKDKNNKFGFIDKNSNQVIIDPIFEKVYEFNDTFYNDDEGGSLVNINGKYGFINKKLEVIIPIKYPDEINFKEDLARVRNSAGMYGYIDRTGNYIIEPKFFDADDFSEGLACVMTGNRNPVFINKKGEVIIGLKYLTNEYDNYTINEFKNGLCTLYCYNNDGKYRYYTVLNKKGEMINSFTKIIESSNSEIGDAFSNFFNNVRTVIGGFTGEENPFGNGSSSDNNEDNKSDNEIESSKPTSKSNNSQSNTTKNNYKGNYTFDKKEDYDNRTEYWYKCDCGDRVGVRNFKGKKIYYTMGIAGSSEYNSLEDAVKALCRSRCK